MDWTRSDVEKKPSYTRQDRDEWDEILRRRKRMQPACTLDGAATLASLDKGATLSHHDSTAGRVTVRWFGKSDGWMRLEAFSTPEGFDDEAAIIDALAKAVQAMVAGGTSVYWYDAAPESPSSDSRVFAELGLVLEAKLRRSGRFTVWEVAA